MGYPEHLLSDDEVIEAEFRPHWSGILREGLIVLIGIAVVVAVALLGWPAWLFAVVVGVVLILIAKGMIRWLTTAHVITSERVIYRSGFIAKQGTEIPLEVIQNVAFNQTLFERMFGTGDLMIESAGTHGQTRYKDIPKPEGVQSLIYRVREQRMRAIEGRTGVAAPAPETSVSQLERLSRLHDDGKLTDAEFEAEKAKLLGGGV
jgi:uncharacterized membrane protein YdbT with pleckstrin-like domain